MAEVASPIDGMTSEEFEAYQEVDLDTLEAAFEWLEERRKAK